MFPLRVIALALGMGSAAFVVGRGAPSWAAGATSTPPGATARPPSAPSAPSPPPPPAAAAVAGNAGIPAVRLPVALVVDRVQKRYDAAQDFRAQFNQTLTNPVMKRKTQSTGEVLLKKPGLMRWNYRLPEPRMYLSDGATLWLYEPEDAQAFKQDLRSSQLPAALAFLTGSGKLAAEFDIKLLGPKEAQDALMGRAVGRERDYLLGLSPRQAHPQIKSLLFVVDPVTFEVRETVIVDSQGNQNDVLFTDIETNTRIPATTFRFTPPAGVRVVDTAKLGK